MLKFGLSTLLLITLTSALSQKDTTHIIQRDSLFMLQATGNVHTAPELYVGQEYVLFVGLSSDLDIKLTAINASLEFDETSKKGTGAMIYKMTPLDTGICRINVGARGKRDYGLMSQIYHVVNYPSPPVFISGTQSGGRLEQLSDSAGFVCKYPESSGIFESYPIKSWTVEMNGATYEGTGNSLSKELINAVNSNEKQTYLYVKLVLEENQTGHTETEGVYIIR